MLENLIKMAEIESEQSKYPCTMTFDEMREITLEDYKKKGRAPLSLDEINQYISEVRNGR